MDRTQHLEEDEDDSDERQRNRERLPVLHRSDQDTHCNREDCRQHAAEGEDRPPSYAATCMGFGQHREEGPFLPLSQDVQHGGIVTQKCGWRHAGRPWPLPPAAFDRTIAATM